jgi:hypothetical protein
VAHGGPQAPQLNAPGGTHSYAYACVLAAVTLMSVWLLGTETAL